MLDKDQARLFAHEVKSYMANYQVSATYLARRSGVDSMMIGAYAHCGLLPSIDDACALLQGIGYTVSEIDAFFDFKSGTAHDAIVERWARDKAGARKRGF